MVARACNALCQEAICARRLFSVVTRRVAQLLFTISTIWFCLTWSWQHAGLKTWSVATVTCVCVCVCDTLRYVFLTSVVPVLGTILSYRSQLFQSCWQRNKAHRALRSAPVFIAVLWLTKRVQLCFHCRDSQFSNFHHHDNTCKYLHVEYIRINLQRNRLLLGTVKTHGSWYIYLSLYTYSCFCSSLFATYLLNMQLTQYNCNTKKYICGE